MTRDERQGLSVQKWINNKCNGIVLAATGVGKTRIALLAIKRFINKNPTKKVLIVVPNDTLVKQWNSEILDWGFSYNCEVTTMFKTSKEELYTTDLLIIDEVHRCLAETLIKVFSVVKYKMLLCLTATLVRVDGMHNYLLEFCPVVDTITMEEAVNNGWISTFKEYKILLDVDLTEYDKYNQKFNEAFAFFDYNFPLCMSFTGKDGWKSIEKFIKDRCPEYSKRTEFRKIVIPMVYQFTQNLQKRKKFISSHPKKIEITNKILEAYQNRKCITFSSTIAMAEKIKYGKVYSGKTSKKEGRATLEDFLKPGAGVINSINKLDAGFNCPEASIGIILGYDSSQTKNTQRIGRLIRIFEGKSDAKIFTLVLKGAVEEKWASNKSTNGYITLDEDGLNKLLAGEQYTPKKEKQTQLTLRF